MVRAAAVLLFAIIEIVLLPVTLVGYLLLLGKAIVFSRDAVGPGGALLLRVTKLLMRLSGEPPTFGLDTNPSAQTRVAAFVSEYSLTLHRFEPYGPETAHRRPFGGAAIAVV
jgi:hypothetical protein